MVPRYHPIVSSPNSHTLSLSHTTTLPQNPIRTIQAPTITPRHIYSLFYYSAPVRSSIRRRKNKRRHARTQNLHSVILAPAVPVDSTRLVFCLLHLCAYFFIQRFRPFLTSPRSCFTPFFTCLLPFFVFRKNDLEYTECCVRTLGLYAPLFRYIRPLFFFLPFTQLRIY